jgi:hypothetical protein
MYYSEGGLETPQKFAKSLCGNGFGVRAESVKLSDFRLLAL